MENSFIKILGLYCDILKMWAKKKHEMLLREGSFK